MHLIKVSERIINLEHLREALFNPAQNTLDLRFVCNPSGSESSDVTLHDDEAESVMDYLTRQCEEQFEWEE